MRSTTVLPPTVGFSTLVLGLLMAAAPASAQWSQIPNIPTTNVFSIQTKADTILAGVDTAAYISTNAGATWKRSSKPTAGVLAVTALWIRNGRLYLGTFGQGVFVSDDLGTTWSPFNEGLVGGILDSQLRLNDLQQRGDSLYAATSGAGVYVRSFAAGNTWHHFGEEFEPAQASNVNDLVLGGNRLIALAGSNGEVFRRDTGDAVWATSFLNNVGLAPGVQAMTAASTGTAFLVGTVEGVFHSALGQEPWTLTDPGLGPINQAALTARTGRAFAAFDIPNFAVMETSGDDGATWQVLEALPHVFVFQLGIVGSALYAARTDGLWVRSVASVSVPDDGGASRLRFALVGAQPFADAARLRFELAERATASIDVFNVAGRRVGERIQASFGPGPHVVSWSAQGLSPGIFAAQLTVGGKRAVVRLVHIH